MNLQTASTFQSPHLSANRGAASLRDALVKNERHLSKERLLAEIESWQSAIKGKNKENPEMRNVFNWYWSEVNSRSYQAPNWRIAPERSALFQKFRSDPYYHLKNLVEIVARGLVEEMLRSEGLDAKVMITSDSDDVFSGVDFIVEVRSPEGAKDYVGFDLAVSENPEYLEKKESRTHTVCREFNHFMGWRKDPQGKERSMLRQVFAIPPKVMAGFLPEYMRRIAQGRPPSAKETLVLLEAAKVRTVSITKERAQSRVAKILH